MEGNLTGRIHSFQSLGAVDGPGLRFVIFMQGCPLRCMYCHNPDSWNMQAGTEYTVDEVVSRVLRYRTYFGEDGGVTVSGGEALLQAPFVAALLPSTSFCRLPTSSSAISNSPTKKTTSRTRKAVFPLF